MCIMYSHSGLTFSSVKSSKHFPGSPFMHVTRHMCIRIKILRKWTVVRHNVNQRLNLDAYEF